MRYLVTGGAGFIGSNTVDELVQRGHSVVVLDDLSGGKEDNLAEVRSKITLIKGTITDLEVVRKAMHEAEFVLHLGARTSVPRSVKDPLETNRINVEGTLNRSEEHTSELQSPCNLVCRLLLEKKKQ